MRQVKFLSVLSCLLLFTTYIQAQPDLVASKGLIQRIVPKHAAQFKVEALKSQGEKDVFEIESSNNKIVLRGNTGVAIASALYYYLKEYCHAQITWNGTNLKLSSALPAVPKKVHKQTSYDYRYYLNYCTFNYSMSWWDWERWEKEIDWMAMHGINMPLAITGEEYVWNEVYKSMGFTDNDLKDFFCGPAYFSWFWMGNLDGWGGPLPKHWMETHFEMQKKIVQREREFGMKPVLPAFTGHVPVAFKNKFPDAKLKKTNWGGFKDTYILDPGDPLFTDVAKKFLNKQSELYGTSHFYSADTFNENRPPSNDSIYLNDLSKKVYEGMKSVDPEAVWVMQGWLFYYDKKFWKEKETQALLNGVPNDKMIILDLTAEVEPVWKQTKAFYGKQWIWNMLNNFGGNTNLFGRMETVAAEPAKALHDPNRGNLKGIGLTMEAIEQNPVIYELMMDNTWSTEPINLDTWLPRYVRNRYGVADVNALKGWDVLRKTVYTVPADKFKRDGAESIIQGRPTLGTSTNWAKTSLNYNAEDLLPAWDAFIAAAPACKNSDGFRFDIVDLTRQILADYALPLQQKMAVAYKEKNSEQLKTASAQFIELIDDMDKLLGTRKDFLLGPWIADARKCGVTAEEKTLYEMNAKDLITLWGDKNSPLNEYACRQWNGLLSDFYKPRWEKFIVKMQEAVRDKKEMDMPAFVNEIKDWEWAWVNKRQDYPTTASGDEIESSRAMYKKYRKAISDVYKKSM